MSLEEMGAHCMSGSLFLCCKCNDHWLSQNPMCCVSRAPSTCVAWYQAPGIRRQRVLLSAINCLVSNADYLFSHFHTAAPSLWVCPAHSLVHSFIQQVYNDNLLWPGPELSLKKLSHFLPLLLQTFSFWGSPSIVPLSLHVLQYFRSLSHWP